MNRLRLTSPLPALRLILPGAALLICVLAWAQVRRDIVIVGSSTVYPFSSFVAEYFGLSSLYSAPRVESIGTGGGFKYFCQGVGLRYPDINNASRAIKNSEVRLCASNGVEDIFEIHIGLDSIVLVSRPDSQLQALSVEEIYRALARWVPDGKSGAMIDNPNRRYSDLNPELADLPIRVLGPPPTSGTRDAFVELVLERACEHQPGMADLKKRDRDAYERYCRTVREDGAFVEAGENDNLILRKVSDAGDGVLGITGFNFYIQNRDVVRALRIDNIAPSRSSVLAGRYPVARPLFMYIKVEHIDMIPGLSYFVDLLLDDFIIGTDGRLSELGLITPGEKVLRETRLRWQERKEKIFGADAGGKSLRSGGSTAP